MRFLVLLLLLGSSARAEAGLHLTRSDGTRLSMEGDSYRIDLPTASDVRAHDAVISSDGDVTAVYVNHQNQTWFTREEAPTRVTSTRFGNQRDAHVRKPLNIEISKEPGLTIAGTPTEKHVIRVSYALEKTYASEKVVSHVQATLIFWSAPTLPAHATIRIVTPFQEVNERLAKALTAVQGLLLQQATSVTEAYEGGRPATDSSSWTTATVENRSFPPSTFESPAGYTHQLTQLGVPTP